MSLSESVYLRLPIFLQNLVVSLEGFRIQARRYGNRYISVERQIHAQSSLNSIQLYELRSRLLRSHFHAAYRSPFWLNCFNQYGVNIFSEDPFSELAKLPVLTKDIVKDNLDDIINPSYSRNSLFWIRTSGTTGSGLVFPSLLSTEHYVWSYWWRYRHCHGLSRKSLCGYFGGRSIVPISQQRPPFWRYNIPARQIMFSCYHLSLNTAPLYLNALQKSGVEWIHGYPSVITLLANYIIDLGLDVNLQNLKCITTGAESISTAQKNVISRAFDVPVVEHYGQAEAVANISQCERGCLHIDEDFSHVEIIDNPQGFGGSSLVGTNWLNPAFPLFRYDTSDLVKTSSLICSCGRIGRVVSSIDGRKEDYIVLPSGAKIGRLDHIFKDMTNVHQAQFVQTDATSVKLFIVKNSLFARRDELHLMSELRQRLGPDIKINIDFVDDIPRTSRGKHRLVKSCLI